MGKCMHNRWTRAGAGRVLELFTCPNCGALCARAYTNKVENPSISLAGSIISKRTSIGHEQRYQNKKIG